MRVGDTIRIKEGWGYNPRDVAMIWIEDIPQLEPSDACIYGACRRAFSYDVDACAAHHGEMCDECAPTVAIVRGDDCFWCAHGDVPGVTERFPDYGYQGDPYNGSAAYRRIRQDAEVGE